MILPEYLKEKLLSEVEFSASKSSGPGGQNVNKVNTQVELRFSVIHSEFLSAHEKELLLIKLKNRINSAGELILVSKAERSQLRNKGKVTNHFFSILEQTLTPAKKRIKTKPTLASKKKRLDAKKIKSKKKQLRRPPEH